MILADIGEVGVHHNEETIVLRPSFYAVSKLGSPSEIVQLFYRVMNATTEQQVIDDCIPVIWACTEGDASLLTGYYDVSGDRLKWVPGSMTIGQIAVLARHLMMHGVTGDVEKRRRKSGGTYNPEFDAAEYAALAMAHLGLSERDAWGMTMTGFVAAMTAKYPPSEKEKELERVLDRYDETMARAKREREARIAREAMKNG